MNKIGNIESQIELIKKEIYSKNFLNNNFYIKIDSKYNNVIKEKLDVARNIIINKYPSSLELLSQFLKYINLMLDKYDNHLIVSLQIKYLKMMRDNYSLFCFKEFKEYISKIKSAEAQLQLIKRDIMIDNICVPNTNLFNLLNDSEYTNYYDVTEFVKKLNIDFKIKLNVEEKIEDITSNNVDEIQKINYLMNDLSLFKKYLYFKKKDLHERIEKLNYKIKSLENKNYKLWPNYPKNYKVSEDYNEKLKIYKKSIFIKILNFIDSLDDLSLSLIYYFCEQLNLFEVLIKDKTSGKQDKFILENANRNTYIFYIQKWLESFRFYLDKKNGGAI